jgi:hypothetical protein
VVLFGKQKRWKAEKVTLIIDFSGPRIGAFGCSEEKK